MSSIFLKVLDMSYVSCYIITSLLVLRLFMIKAPKKYAILLWFFVFIRLMVPWTIESDYSNIPDNAINITNNRAFQAERDIGDIIINKTTGIADNSRIYDAEIEVSVQADGDVKSKISIVDICSKIWFVGIIVLLTYTGISYLVFKKRIQLAIRVEDNVYMCDRVDSPCIFGIINPKIYIPNSIEYDDKGYILAHERMHIKTKDNLFKFAFFMSAIIHWFNPLVWLSYYMLNRDIEMACDERVLESYDIDIRKNYANLLLDMATSKNRLVGPLAFGENSIKSRIKNIIRYRKPTKFMAIIMTILVLLCLVAYGTNPIKEGLKDQDLSFLNIDNVVKVMALSNDPLVISYKDRSVEIESNKISELLYDGINDWKEVAGILNNQNYNRLYIYSYCDGRFNSIEIIEAEGRSECIIIDDFEKKRYYHGPKDLYEKMVLLGEGIDKTIPNLYVDLISNGIKTSDKSKNNIPDDVEKFYTFELASKTYYVYEKDNKAYCELPHSFINRIDRVLYIRAKYLLDQDVFKRPVKIVDTDDEIIKDLVEKNLNYILSVQSTSSDPKDYIHEKQEEYETILKQGYDAVDYILKQFDNRNVSGLKAQLMMMVCNDVLGVRVKNPSYNDPYDWYEDLHIRKLLTVSDYMYTGDDINIKLVYESQIERYGKDEGKFLITYPHIFGVYEEGDLLKIVATVYNTSYRVYEDIVEDVGGSIRPIAITYKKSEGEYELVEYKEALDGSLYGPSINEFCVYPRSKEIIKGLSGKIKRFRFNEEDEIAIMDILKKHLRNKNIIVEKDEYGNVILYQ